MKKVVRIILIVLAVLALAFVALRFYTKSHSPFEKVEASHGPLSVAVEYCKPLMKGRKIFGETIPYNTVWRTGANEATLIAFSKNCTMAGRKLKGDTYSLWTIPGEKYWDIIINSETGQWGTNYDEKKNYLQVKVPAGKLPSLQEQLNISLTEVADGIDMKISWENTEVIVPIR
jgi:Protein of unknown function (DUF2911)